MRVAIQFGIEQAVGAADELRFTARQSGFGASERALRSPQAMTYGFADRESIRNVLRQDVRLQSGL